MSTDPSIIVIILGAPAESHKLVIARAQQVSFFFFSEFEYGFGQSSEFDSLFRNDDYEYGVDDDVDDG